MYRYGVVPEMVKFESVKDQYNVVRVTHPVNLGAGSVILLALSTSPLYSWFETERANASEGLPRRPVRLH